MTQEFVFAGGYGHPGVYHLSDGREYEAGDPVPEDIPEGDAEAFYEAGDIEPALEDAPEPDPEGEGKDIEEPVDGEGEGEDIPAPDGGEGEGVDIDPEDHTRDELDALALDAGLDPADYATKADVAAALNAEAA